MEEPVKPKMIELIKTDMLSFLGRVPGRSLVKLTESVCLVKLKLTGGCSGGAGLIT